MLGFINLFSRLKKYSSRIFWHQLLLGSRFPWRGRPVNFGRTKNSGTLGGGQQTKSLDMLNIYFGIGYFYKTKEVIGHKLLGGTTVHFA